MKKSEIRTAEIYVEGELIYTVERCDRESFIAFDERVLIKTSKLQLCTDNEVHIHYIK